MIMYLTRWTLWLLEWVPGADVLSWVAGAGVLGKVSGVGALGRVAGWLNGQWTVGIEHDDGLYGGSGDSLRLIADNSAKVADGANKW